MLNLLVTLSDPIFLQRLRTLVQHEYAGLVSVYACESLSQAVPYLKEKTFDLALVGIDLPDAPGLDGLKRLKEANPALPVVLAGALTDEALICQAYEMGIRGIIDPQHLKTGWMESLIASARLSLAGRGHALLSAINTEAILLLQSSSWRAIIQDVLASLGSAACASRAAVLVRSSQLNGGDVASLAYEWTAPGITPQLENPRLHNLPADGSWFAELFQAVSTLQPYSTVTADLPAREREWLTARDVRSYAAIPIPVNGDWWGFIALDDCLQECIWKNRLLQAMQTAANILGASITQEQNQHDFREIVEQSRQGVVVIAGGEIIYANPIVQRSLEWATPNDAGQDSKCLSHYVLPEDLPQVSAAITLVENDVKPSVLLEMRAVVAGGAVRWIESRISRLFYQGRKCILALLNDITPRKEAESRLNMQLLIDQVLADLSTSFIDTPGDKVDDAIRAALERLATALDLDRFFVTTLSLADGKVEQFFEWLRTEPNPSRPSQIPVSGPQWQWARAQLENQEMISFSDLSSIKPEEERIEMMYWRERGIQSILIVPMSYQKRLMGSLSAATIGRAHAWTTIEMAALRMVSEMFAGLEMRRRTETALRESEAQSRLVLEAMDDVVALHAADGTCLYATPSIERFSGRGLQEIIGTNLLEKIYPEDREKFDIEHSAQLERGEDFTFRWRYKQPSSGKILWLETSFQHIPAQPYGGAVWLSTSRNITARKFAEEALKEANERLRQSVQHLERLNEISSQFILLGNQLQSAGDTGDVYAAVSSCGGNLFPNSSGSLYIIPPGEQAMELTANWGSMEPVRAAEAENHLRPYAESIRVQNLGYSAKQEQPLFTENLEQMIIPLWAQNEFLGLLHLRGVNSGSEDIYYQYATLMAQRVTLTLVTNRLREDLRSQSIRDALTGLYNRRHMEDVLQKELANAVQTGSSVAVIMADLDHFKEINDLYGHEAGDVVLRSVARFLQSHVHLTDIVCRYGGDEFLLIMPGLNQEEAYRRAEYLRQESQRMSVQHRDELLRGINISVGVAISPGHGATPEDLVRAADMALYRAKRLGRNRVELAKAAIFDEAP